MLSLFCPSIKAASNIGTVGYDTNSFLVTPHAIFKAMVTNTDGTLTITKLTDGRIVLGGAGGGTGGDFTAPYVLLASTNSLPNAKRIRGDGLTVLMVTNGSDIVFRMAPNGSNWNNFSTNVVSATASNAANAITIQASNTFRGEIVVLDSFLRQNAINRAIPFYDSGSEQFNYSGSLIWNLATKTLQLGTNVIQLDATNGLITIEATNVLGIAVINDAINSSRPVWKVDGRGSSTNFGTASMLGGINNFGNFTNHGFSFFFTNANFSAGVDLGRVVNGSYLGIGHEFTLGDYGGVLALDWNDTGYRLFNISTTNVLFREDVVVTNGILYGNGLGLTNLPTSVTNARNVDLKAGTNGLKTLAAGWGLLKTNESGSNLIFAVDNLIIPSQVDINLMSNDLRAIFTGGATFNGEVSLTNATVIGLVYDRISNTNRLRSLQGGYGMILTNQSTNVVSAVDPFVIARQADLVNASNILETATSNNVVVTGSGGITVTPSGSAGRMTYAVTGGGFLTNGPRTLYADTTHSEVTVGGFSLQNLSTYTIPANTLSRNGDRIKAKWTGGFSAPGATERDIAVSFGGSQQSLISMPANAFFTWELEAVRIDSTHEVVSMVGSVGLSMSSTNSILPKTMENAANATTAGIVVKLDAAAFHNDLTPEVGGVFVSSTTVEYWPAP